MRHLKSSSVSIDPFAGDRDWCSYTNDLNPHTRAQSHLDAEDFLIALAAKGVKADLAIFDPPYSPRQISELYSKLGAPASKEDTQNASLYQRVRNALMPVLAENAMVLSFGWNSVGMGKNRGFEIIEIILCCHGGAHNDTICLAEKRL
ncbi:MAG TPA: adenine-specific DNA methylase [Verrucomicrobiae bacterium]|jgi:hypothetical protein|nr:adenine-specific DNA methylase [Verrucomicrobiae bacterium]